MYALILQGEVQRDLDRSKEAIKTFTQVVEIQDRILQMYEIIDKAQILVFLSEELIKEGQIQEGVQAAEQAL